MQPMSLQWLILTFRGTLGHFYIDLEEQEDLEAAEMFCDFPSAPTTFAPDFVMLKPGSLPSLDTWEEEVEGLEVSLEDFLDIFFFPIVGVGVEVGAILEEASTVIFLSGRRFCDY